MTIQEAIHLESALKTLHISIVFSVTFEISSKLGIPKMEMLPMEVLWDKSFSFASQISRDTICGSFLKSLCFITSNNSLLAPYELLYNHTWKYTCPHASPVSGKPLLLQTV